MQIPGNVPLVSTIKERCRVCYTCVRECPAKAIRIADGQAEVIGARCIGCGNCVRVCSQHAKRVLREVDAVTDMLAGPWKVAACVAPSFPAEFFERDPLAVPGLLQALGFDYVVEVAYGADRVAGEYARMLRQSDGKRYIATTCPAVVGFVERYRPGLVDSLAPIVSPMLATARAVHALYGKDVKVVFIGPCIAKKGEAASPFVAGEVDAALTFTELREMLRLRGVDTLPVAERDFDPPHPGTGMLFPISRGMLQASGIGEDLLTGDVVAADGRETFIDAIDEFESGDLEARLLEVLCCEGCIMGSGMSCQTPLFRRRSRVSQYVRTRMAETRAPLPPEAEHRLAGISLQRRYEANDQRIPVPSDLQMDEILRRMGKFSPEDELNCGACGYDTCVEHAVAIYKGLAETEMCLPYTIEHLKKTIGELAVSNEALAETQEALLQAEKLASMGQLAAGVAHEVNNPLGVVLMYAHLLLQERENDPDIGGDLKMIAEQADRCRKIVSGLLDFARQNKVVLRRTNLRELVENTLKVLRFPANVQVQIDHDGCDPMAEVDRDQIVQVLTNLVSNALAAMPDGGSLTLGVAGDAGSIVLSVADTGIGIPEDHLTKIFEPFFTTKQIGKGTGLGLAVTYGIVKMHRGDISVRSNADPSAGPTGATFEVKLPRKGQINNSH